MRIPLVAIVGHEEARSILVRVQLGSGGNVQTTNSASLLEGPHGVGTWWPNLALEQNELQAISQNFNQHHVIFATS